jgi:hypothetical protein
METIDTRARCGLWLDWWREALKTVNGIYALYRKRVARNGWRPNPEAEILLDAWARLHTGQQELETEIIKRGGLLLLVP